MNAPKTSLRSGELAHLTGVSADTIRHYERIGILQKTPRTSSGYRIYSHDSVERVRLVRRALLLGFSLAEMSEILKVRDNGGAPCRRVLQLTEEKLVSLSREIEALRGTQRCMQQLVREWRAKLAQTAFGSKAMLLHSLPSKQASVKSTSSFRRRIRP